MKKYLTFINEIGHYPTPIQQIYNIIEEFCFDQLERYINSKGKFYNHNITEKFDWYDIKDKLIDLESFKKFPVEEINIKFSINVRKDTDKQGYSSAYQPLNKYDKDVISSRLKPSQSKLVKKAISLVVEIGLEIQKDVESIEIETFENFIESNLTHELTHAYQDYQEKIKNIRFTNVWDTMGQLANERWYSVIDSYSIKEFIWLIYKTSYPELNADIAAGIKKFSNVNAEIIEKIENFNPEISYEKAISELKEENYDIKDVEKNFGKNFIDIYLHACKLEKVEPDPKVLKLKDKDMKYIFQYWDKIFKRRLQYIKKKLKK